MHVTTPQYTSRFLEVAEGASWLVQTYLCACGLYFAVELEVNSTVKVALSSLLLLLVFLLVVCICVIGLKLLMNNEMQALSEVMVQSRDTLF